MVAPPRLIMVAPPRLIRPQTFPPRAYRRHTAILGVGSDVFLAAGEGGFQPGPAEVTGGGVPAPTAAQVALENPRLIGFVVKQSESVWLAFRTQTWGGTHSVGSKFDRARDFIQAACGGAFLRQVRTRLADGTEAIQFWNDCA